MLLDARPDRIDFRDREFRSQLVSLPNKYPADQHISLFLEQYQQEGMILDQKLEGACTGFGLATVINYLNWYRKALDHWKAQGITQPTSLPTPDEKVSEWMIYNTARLYDEWEGEDYVGSSCRGAMKGWHKHGVCTQSLWPKGGPGEDNDKSWRQSAAQRPLGSYYRVNVQSIADMQAAIYEVGAVYCSAWVHSGWFFRELPEAPETIPYHLTRDDRLTELRLPVIQFSTEQRGGHAFAIVGYTARGFIVQNSWGPNWARTWGAQNQAIENAAGGFALIIYEDWIHNAHDAWVAALAAPIRISDDTCAPVTHTKLSLLEQAAQSGAERTLSAGQVPAHPGWWSEGQARRHCIEMGNDGKLIKGRIDTASAQDDLRQSMDALLKDYSGKDIMIFAHGGLNDRDSAVRRAQMLGPWFETNGILPVFIVWRTGFGESLINIGKDFINSTFPILDRSKSRPVREFFDQLTTQIKERSDRGFEVLAEKIMGKAVWSQIKQNAEAANKKSSATGLTGGMRELADYLRHVLKDRADLRLHLLGHSAGSIILGHFARDLAQFSRIASLGLLAPACTLKFANKCFVPLVEDGKLDARKFYIVNLSRENERTDCVGPYNKSLLYLVSRAFEVPRKMPLLGLEDSWILDIEVQRNKDAAHGVTIGLGSADERFYQALLIAKLGPYYALTGQKQSSDFVTEANKARNDALDVMAALHNLSDLDDRKGALQLLEHVDLNPLTRNHGLHDVMAWRNFAIQHPFAYRRHIAPNVKIQKHGDLSAYETTAHGNIDNDIEIMNWAMTHMIGEPATPITDLKET